MFKVFLKGVVFGLGALVALFIGSVALALLFQRVGVNYVFDPDQQITASESIAQQHVPRNFGDMTIEEQITSASVIFVTRFESGEDGRQKAVISEILKSPSSGAFSFQVGDEYGRLSVYPGDSSDYGDGYVTFMKGEPPEFQFSTTIRKGRVGSFGGIPLIKLREKIPNS